MEIKLVGLVVAAISIFPLLLPSTESSIVLESENVTNWGDWGPWDGCPKNSYASAFQLKTEPHDKSLTHDDTGLNAIKLYCSKPGSTDWIGRVTSSEGDFGNWGIKFRCTGGAFVTGFQLRAEKPQGGLKSGNSHAFGGRDDYGATGLRVYCSGESDFVEGDGLDRGEWQRKMSCLANQYVCALRTQIDYNAEVKKSVWNKVVDERWIGFGDYTALNNIRMKCCDIPNPGETCVPSDSWETVLSCDATDRTSPYTCRFDKKIGVSKHTSQSGGTSQSDSNTVGGSTGIGLSLSALSTNFGVNYSKSKGTGHDWRHESSGTWNTESSTVAEFVVQAGQMSELQQIVGRCGDFVVRTTNFKVTDYDRDGNLLG